MSGTVFADDLGLNHLMNFLFAKMREVESFTNENLKNLMLTTVW